MTTQAPVVRVGVAAVVRDAQGRMVMGVRKVSHGNGAFSALSWLMLCFRWRLPESGPFPTVTDTGYRHGSGQWQFPGGHLEVGESYFACAERETLEETGLVVRAEKLLGLTNDVFSPTKHYITIFVLCQRVDESQEPEVR